MHSPFAPLSQHPWSLRHPGATLPGANRQFLGHEFVYCVISQRANGLSVGVNMNPDGRCNFDCVYCEVDRAKRHGPRKVPVAAMVRELEDVLRLAYSGALHEAGFPGVPEDLLKLQEVALSGDGEPTLCPNFAEVVRSVVHLRARRLFPFFKVVLITNASGLGREGVRRGLELLTSEDEVWAKLEVGTQAHMAEINRPHGVTLGEVLTNILALGKERPIVIQSLFVNWDGVSPTEEEIETYVRRLAELKAQGAQIKMVQVYSAHRPSVDSRCTHLALKSLSHIARRVREVAGLRAEVF